MKVTKNFPVLYIHNVFFLSVGAKSPYRCNWIGTKGHIIIIIYLDGLDPHDEPADVADCLGDDGEGEHEVLKSLIQAQHDYVHQEAH